MHTWVLPEYIEDILPNEAHSLETTRRTLLDLFRVHGYDLVVPPMFEYVESLRTGAGMDMDYYTFKVVDQMSGRLIALRADITPQVARIDAQLLNRAGVTRLCYAASVLHTMPLGLARSREPLQIGAEIYGHAGIDSDIEIQKLMLESLAAAGISDMHLDLGHVGIFRSLARRFDIDGELESDLFHALQAKDVPLLDELTRGMQDECRAALLLLPELYGGREVLEKARAALGQFAEILVIVEQLEEVFRKLSGNVERLSVDLAQLRGYHYHSGMVFALYVKGCPNALAQGGRYDEVGKAFGRARPATGFSLDLRELCRVAPGVTRPQGVWAPALDDQALLAKIDELRSSGVRVVVDLAGEADGLDCSGSLQSIDGVWQVVAY